MRKLIKGDEPEEFKKIKDDLMNKGYEKVLFKNIPIQARKIVREMLLLETNNKCAFCESKIENQEDAVDNFYPKSKFPERVLDWENLLASCRNCNSYKGSKFPLDMEGKPLLLNPYIDDPFEHLNFTVDGLLESSTEKGRITIDVLGLNRFDLRHKRKTNLQKFERLKINKSRNELEYEEFLGCYTLYRNHLSQLARTFENLDLNRLKDIEQKENQLKVFRNKTIYIDTVQIKNFKAIDDLEIKFKKFEIESKVPCLMLLGENGAGKTSIIQAISLALLSKDSNDLDKILKKNKDIIKDSERNNSAEIKINYSEDDSSILIIYDGYKDVQNTGQKIPILSYGAIRVERKIPVRDEHIKFLNNPNRISNAFSPRELMINANEWLIKLSKEEFSIVKEILEELLQLNETGESLERNRTSVFVIKNTNKVKIYLWSEGRRNVLVLVCDMLAHLSALWDKGNLHKDDIKEYSGVVMIDEIGAHLHPTWKMKIVSQLRKTFPKLQFICTTHDPLCLIGFKQGEIVVLRKDKDGKVFMVNQEDLPNPEAMRADQLLTSQYFGLNSTIDLDIEKKFAEYYDLLARGDKLSDQNKERLKTLKDFIQDKKMLGDTTREKLYYDIIDKVLAERNLSNAVNTLSLKEEVIQRINEALKSRKI